MSATETYEELRARLSTKRIGIIGLGGLGSNAAGMLVRSGVRQFVLADFDDVDESNLNRQMYFREDLGKPKTECLAAILRRMEPDLDLTLLNKQVAAEDVIAIGRQVDILLEAVDCADTKAMILNTCVQELPGLPLVAASGLAGFGSANAIVTEAVSEHLWVVGDQISDVMEGHPLFASRVMLAAAHQAHAVVRLILGFDEP